MFKFLSRKKSEPEVSPAIEAKITGKNVEYRNVYYYANGWPIPSYYEDAEQGFERHDNLARFRALYWEGKYYDAMGTELSVIRKKQSLG